MRALHVITGLGTGGAEQQLRLLLRHLPVDCDVVTLTDPGPVAEGLAADGVHVVHLGMRGNRDLAALPRLARLIRRGRYDLVHTHLYRACLYGRIAARLAGVRAVVATEHSLGDSQMEGRPLTAGVRALYLAGERLGRSTVAVSPTVAERLTRWGVPGPRIAVVPNGIDLERFRFDPGLRLRTRARLGLPDDAFVIGGVGRLAPGKRFDVLIRALAGLPGDCRLLLVGGGGEEGALRGAARLAGVADRVVFAGERPHGCDPAAGPDLPALASAMDVLASPSAEEAFGLAVVEALAAGLPVRYTSCPAVEDLPPGAAPGALRVEGGTDAYTRALAEVRAAGPGPRTAPEAARHYCIARSASRLMDVYAAALARTVPEPRSSQGVTPP
ncbi:glycosyltransferase [Streptomyces collinus]|uniref:D-inositol 3-phosphate glycosyltransferase n=1 Tax=Streptomyces collinus (strain DSM 40733 / Tue 365) TaxID=1214242 RepID=S5VGL6_STRC3|nr:glycosyltransferase [Streptomyces collinus]AGS69692.1 glycosyl transferase family protein [Streptomyces collinus Tu 365]UJA08333.1 glycosyltransferase [Streptomyces collinus]UJA16802.1 glycosyltransferase [Streptomyces collinus]